MDDETDSLPDDPTRAVLCAPGFFGAFSCMPAPAGKFVADSGALVATDCLVGRFSSTEGSAACDLAPIGFFVNVTGASSATACPEGATTESTGSASAEACIVEGVLDSDFDGVMDSADICPVTTVCLLYTSPSPRDRG